MKLDTEHHPAITPEWLETFSERYHKDPLRTRVANAVQQHGIQAAALNPQHITEIPFTFSHEISSGPITHQRQSGRCWIFAGLNTLRVPLMRQNKIKEFEISQTYLMFWDKLEKANYFLENILETLDEPTDGRLIAWLLQAPVQDGGQWDMLVNLIQKYGVVPKYIMPETFHSSQSMLMNRLLTLKLREDAFILREKYRVGEDSSQLSERKMQMVADIYQMLVHFLGEPPRKFTFEFRDEDNQFHQDVNLTPQAFYDKYIGIDLNQYVSLIHAPTADKPFGRTYTVQFLGNVKGGRPVRYLNVEIPVLKEAAKAQILDDEPVWFGCDVGKMSDRTTGIMDPDLFDYGLTLGVPFTMDKATRLEYGESQMTHAMVLTGVNLIEGKPNRWKVENSWGTEPGNQGFFVMSDTWFDEYLYQVVVHKKYLSDELLEALHDDPIVLPPWDPMGSLAY
ncbi:aminopeptidase C [Sulfobacillus thermosulfidooxidans]|uniref:aminopeptidase C n=1 Tax=Sulfobacillus thermosulfidooxidans TaxID=28034 RepID=UPI0006B5D15D|nr:C1 family peptidase [Sulfobacillus thermosulfidooxidans]